MMLNQQVNAAMAELTGEIKSNKLTLLSPPDLLLEVRSFATNQDSTVEEFANLIKHDPNISGRLIKVANSVLIGSRNPVTTVKAAISRLGSAKVQTLVTSLVIAQNFMSAKMRGLEPYFNQVWHSSSNVAALSYVLANKKTSLEPEQALLAGMVHNIGILPIILRLNQISTLKHEPKLLIQIANRIMPKLYPIAGKLILQNWNFSAEISQTAFSHNKPQLNATAEIELHDIIFIANELNKLSSVTDIKNIPQPLLDSSSFKKIWKNEAESIDSLAELSLEIAIIKDTFTA